MSFKKIHIIISCFLFLSIGFAACKKKTRILAEEEERETTSTSDNPNDREDGGTPGGDGGTPSVCNIDDADIVVVNGVLTRWKVENTNGNYTIPGCVHTIATNAFKNTRVSTVTVPETVTKIETEAFSNSQLENIFINGNPDFSAGAFKEATSLKYLSASDWTKLEIPESLFENCTSLTQINPTTRENNITLSHIRKIGKNAFKGCTALEQLNAPILEEIGESAFENCAKLTSMGAMNPKIIKASAFKNSGVKIVTINTNLTELGASAFEGCVNLTSLDVKEGVILHTISQKAFFGCSKIQSFLLRSIQNVEEKAFGNCTALTSANLGMIKNIGTTIFEGCTNLTTITLEAQDVPTVANKTSEFFGTISKLTKILVPDKINGSTSATQDIINKYKADWTAYTSKIQGSSLSI